jgi:(p)ppGpp synthase/HD superfamily hydrolase
MLDRAIALAVRCHAGQYRKHAIGGQRLPYIAHLIEVMKTVWGWGVTDPIIMTAAVLHDILEDSDVTSAQLAKEFGEEVARSVVELTHDPQDGGKSEYLKRFAAASVPALVIKLADRYCNLQHRLLADPNGVEAYFGKSAVLLEILRARRAEIAGRFGEKTAAAIASAYQSLEIAVRQIAGDVRPDQRNNG